MIFHIGKTEFKLTFSFVALLGIMVIVCEEKIVIYSLLSSVIHESGHLLFMYLFKTPPEKIELSLFGIRIDRTEKVCISYKKRFLRL